MTYSFRNLQQEKNKNGQESKGEEAQKAGRPLLPTGQ